MAGAMPSVTMVGAMIRAQLAAYRRTLKKTMEQSRSMDQVVAEAGLEWLDTPDQAVVWGTALGLQEEIEKVLERSLDDVKDGRATSTGTYFPAWYGGSGGQGFANTGGGGGIFSSSGIPNIGGMMAALGTIGNSPAASGSSGAAVGSRVAEVAAAGVAPAAASRSSDPEQRSAAVQTLHVDREPSTRLPQGPGHAVFRGLPRHALRASRPKPFGS